MNKQCLIYHSIILWFLFIDVRLIGTNYNWFSQLVAFRLFLLLISTPNGTTHVRNVIMDRYARALVSIGSIQIVSIPNIVANPRYRWNKHIVHAATIIQFSFEHKTKLRCPMHRKDKIRFVVVRWFREWISVDMSLSSHKSYYIALQFIHKQSKMLIKMKYN